jgi:hypothetical protein
LVKRVIICIVPLGTSLIGFAVIRYVHLFVFFAKIRSHVVFAFRWFRINSLFASIRFSQ